MRWYAYTVGAVIMNRTLLSWLLFVGFLSLLVFSTSSFVRVADSLLWPIRFGAIAGFSALLVWSGWRRRGSADAQTKRDSADQFLASVIRWYHGDTKR